MRRLVFAACLLEAVCWPQVTLPSYQGILAGGSVPLPCDVLANAGTPCIAAHGVIRKLRSAYSGNLFQIQRASDSTTLSIGTTASGIADTSGVGAFCAGTTCNFSIIYDQMGTPATGNNLPQATTVNQSLLAWTTWNGVQVPSLVIPQGQFYRNRASTVNMPTGSAAMTEYMVVGTKTYATVGTYGNMESTVSDTGAGHMFALSFSTSDSGSTATGIGPWAGVDWENGTFSYGPSYGTSTPYYLNILSKYIPGGPTWVLKSSDATQATVTTLHNGSLPTGYSAHWEGGLSLGEGGDASPAPVNFLEGAIAASATTDATDSSLQASLAGFYNRMGPPFAQPYSYQSGIVGHWILCGDVSSGSGCSPTSSTTVYDSSGSGNNGTWSGTQNGTTDWYSAGRVGGYAGRFLNAPYSLVTTGNVALGNTFTAAAWIFPTGINAFARLVTTNYGSGFYVGTDSAGTQYQMIVNATGSGGLGSCTGGTVRQNAWDYVVGTYDGTNAKLYVNGALLNTCAFAAPGSTNLPIRIGADSGGSQGFTGRINDVRVYNIVWALSDVQAVYNAER